MRTAWNAAITLCVVALAATACSSSSGSSSHQVAASGGTFTFAMADDPGNLNPLKTVQTPDADLFKFLYDDLVHVAAIEKRCRLPAALPNRCLRRGNHPQRVILRHQRHGWHRA